MIIIKGPGELERMRASGKLAAQVLDQIARSVGPGVTTKELDDLAAQILADRGAKSAFLGYRGYPGNICISLNDEVVHGIPGKRRIEIGDLVSIDVGVRWEGFVGDTATTVLVGVSDPEVLRLVAVTRRALEEGIAAARCGGWLSDISHAIQQCVESHGFSVVREFVGHGIGRDMHEDPQVPNFGRPGQGPKLKAGMTIAIEPMVNMGRCEVDIQEDGWTVCTRDGKPSAHCEHTIAIGEAGPEILTAIPA